MNWIIWVFWTDNRKMLRNCQDSLLNSDLCSPAYIPDPDSGPKPGSAATFQSHCLRYPLFTTCCIKIPILSSLILNSSERGVTWIPFFRWRNSLGWWSQAAMRPQVFLIPGLIFLLQPSLPQGTTLSSCLRFQSSLDLFASRTEGTMSPYNPPLLPFPPVFFIRMNGIIYQL